MVDFWVGKGNKFWAGDRLECTRFISGFYAGSNPARPTKKGIQKCQSFTKLSKIISTLDLPIFSQKMEVL